MENALCRHTAKSGVNPSVRKTRQSRLAGVLATMATSGSLSADSLSHDRSTGDEARVQPLTEKRFNSCLGEKVDGHVFRTWKTDRDLLHFPSVLRQTLTLRFLSFIQTQEQLCGSQRKVPEPSWMCGRVVVCCYCDYETQS